MSLASAESAEARRKAATTLGYYNLKLGPAAWRFSSALGLDWSDNVRGESLDPKEDIIVRPEAGAKMLLPVTDQNSLSLSFGGGYSAYLQHSEYNRFFVTPDTELSFDLYVKDFWFNFHNRFSITEDTYRDPTVVGVGDYSRMENDAGVTGLWDLNKVVLRLGFDHINYMSLAGQEGAYPDGQSEVVFATAGIRLAVDMTAGLEMGGGLVQYDFNQDQSAYFTDAIQWNIGGFYEARLTEYMRGRASIGYTAFMPDFQEGVSGATDFAGWYAQVGLSHRLNQYVDYVLTGGRTVSFTFYGGTIDLYSANLGVNWRILREIDVNTAVSYQHGSYLYGYSEEFDHVGPNITFSRRITEKLAASLGYQLYSRSSNLPDRDYIVNIVALRARYEF